MIFIQNQKQKFVKHNVTYVILLNTEKIGAVKMQQKKYKEHSDCI